MTRFGRPGRFKDFFGAALVAAAFALLGIQTMPAAELPENVTSGDAVTECSATDTAPAPDVDVQGVTVRI